MSTSRAGPLMATIVLVLGPGCEQRRNEAPTVPASPISGTHLVLRLDDRLLNGLSERQQWSASKVKIYLARPTVSTVLSSKEGREAVLHAWPGSQNDYSVAMMRLDSSDTLYALTDQEWKELSDRAKSSPASSGASEPPR